MITQSDLGWIPTDKVLPSLYADVRIRLKDNPSHDPGNVILDSTGWWAGYQRAYHPDEVSHWRELSDQERKDSGLPLTAAPGCDAVHIDHAGYVE